MLYLKSINKFNRVGESKAVLHFIQMCIPGYNKPHAYLWIPHTFLFYVSHLVVHIFLFYVSRTALGLLSKYAL